MEKHTLRRSLVLAAALAAAVGAVRLADAAPTNDAFASATALTGSAPVVTSTNVGATRQSGEPTQGRGGGHTVWYSWTAPASGSTTIDTLGSALDTVVAVYTGSRVDRLTLVGYDDDTGSPTTGASKLTFTAASGPLSGSRSCPLYRPICTVAFPRTSPHASPVCERVQRLSASGAGFPPAGRDAGRLAGRAGREIYPRSGDQCCGR